MENEYIPQISQLNPSTNVNDENTNIPLQELQSNLNYLLNLMSGSTNSPVNFLSNLYGNLLDYDNAGNKLFFNGGNFDCFEKKNSWLAVDNGNVANQTEIQNIGAADLLVYTGGVSYIDTQGEHGIWLEREFYIPQILRGSELVFVVKGTGVNTDPSQVVDFDYVVPYCNVSTVPGISSVGVAVCISGSPISGAPCVPNISGGCYARYEDIGIEVIGAIDVVQDVVTLGPWPSHMYYAGEPYWLPEYRSRAINFRVGKNTDTVTIRIRRTRIDGAIAFSQMFLGGLPQPYLSYDIEHLDINELYNFSLGITKWNATTVNGHSVARNATHSKLPNLLTKEQFLHLSQFVRNVDEFDWDQLNGPMQKELELSTYSPSAVNNTNVFAFDPGFDRYMYYDMRVDGPDPGPCYVGVSYFVDADAFSGSISCSGQSCGNISFTISTAVINTGQTGNPLLTTDSTFNYVVPINAFTAAGNMGYFEVYGDFYANLQNSRGAIVYFTVSRNGTDPNDTFQGNLLIAGMKTGIAVPPDDQPTPGSYPNLFIGEISC